jgi:protocatechuate 3,4-dioxygenase beta subunit
MITLGAGEQRQLDVALVPVPVATATLLGYVTDATTGQPIAGAVVELSGGYAATTDSQGYYQVLNIVPGSYSGQVSAAGYEPYTF